MATSLILSSVGTRSMSTFVRPSIPSVPTHNRHSKICVDFGWWAHNAIYRLCISEMYTWILYGSINQDHLNIFKMFICWMKNGWISKCVAEAPRHIILMGQIHPTYGVIWGRPPESTHSHTPRVGQKSPPGKSNHLFGEGFETPKGENETQKVSKHFSKDAFNSLASLCVCVCVCVCVFLYKVFPITVALSVSESISSEFLCRSCQTYGINQGLGAGALAAGMLTAWQTRGSGVVESPSLWLHPGRRTRGGGER